MGGVRIGGQAVLQPPPELDEEMIWNVRQASGGTDRLFALGVPGVDSATYLSQSRVNANLWTLDLPVLSPDLTEYVYTRQDTGAPGTNRTALMRCASDDASAPVLIAETPSTGAAITGRLMEILGWSPDGQEVYYRGQVQATVVGQGEIRKVNRDGTGDTQIWTNASITSVMFGIYPRISPDGTMLAFWVDFDGTAGGFQGLWTLNEDGTNVQHIYTSPDSGGNLPDDFYGWSPDSEWLLFRDSNWNVSPRVEAIYKCRPDGSDLTTLASPTATVDPPMHLSQGQYSLWLDDASGIVCAQDDGAGANDIGVLLTDGSETFTPLSTAQSIDGASYADGPILNKGLNRIYWYVGQGLGVGNMQVVSCELDGSGYRVDDDMVTPATHDDYLAIGFYKRAS